MCVFMGMYRHTVSCLSLLAMSKDWCFLSPRETGLWPLRSHGSTFPKIFSEESDWSCQSLIFNFVPGRRRSTVSCRLQGMKSYRTLCDSSKKGKIRRDKPTARKLIWSWKHQCSAVTEDDTSPYMRRNCLFRWEGIDRRRNVDNEQTETYRSGQRDVSARFANKLYRFCCSSVFYVTMSAADICAKQKNNSLERKGGVGGVSEEKEPHHGEIQLIPSQHPAHNRL